jgi:hypothetical protein
LLYVCEGCGSEYWINYYLLRSNPSYFGDTCDCCDKPLELQVPYSVTVNMYKPETKTAPTNDSVPQKKLSLYDQVFEVVEAFGATSTLTKSVMKDNPNAGVEELIKLVLAKL